MIEKKLFDVIVSALLDMKAQHLISIDLTSIENAPASTFIICQGTSTTHVGALAEAVEKKVSKILKEKPRSLEGKAVSEWILLDYFDIMIHIFLPKIREKYDLENLWGDGISTSIN